MLPWPKLPLTTHGASDKSDRFFGNHLTLPKDEECNRLVVMETEGQGLENKCLCSLFCYQLSTIPQKMRFFFEEEKKKKKGNNSMHEMVHQKPGFRRGCNWSKSREES